MCNTSFLEKKIIKETDNADNLILPNHLLTKKIH